MIKTFMTQIRSLPEPDQLRHDWTQDEAHHIIALPLNDLIFEAQIRHRHFYPANAVQKSTLLSIKTGGCPEDCAYCAQSAKFETGIKATKLMDADDVLKDALAAKQAGATRYCMGAAWREVKDRDMEALCKMVEGVKKLGMESCMTLGMLTQDQARRLKQAGLDYYNHNIDTSPDFYDKIITTRTFDERLETLAHLREANINVCCGGIIGLGEEAHDRADMLMVLANLPTHPQSVPINRLIPMKGTPLADQAKADIIDFVRVIAAARIMMPASVVRIAAGRENMSDEAQALCFLAGANSIFIGERLLTAKNPGLSKDEALLDRLGLQDLPAHHSPAEIR